MQTEKTRTRAALAVVLALVMAVGAFLSASPAAALTATVFSNSTDSAYYPRVVKAADGALLATYTRYPAGGGAIAPVEVKRSTDGGANWTTHSTIADYHGLDSTHLLAPTLFVTPQTLGSYPAGTVFLAFTYELSTTTVGSVQIFRSTNNGASWTWHSETGFNKPYDSWEPEFVVDSTGRLVLFYSDESMKGSGYSQAIVREISTDGGVTWGSYQMVLGANDNSWRPGMPRVTKLNNGTYLLAYESISDSAGNGIIRTKTSTTGTDFGTPTDRGSVVTSGLQATPALGYNSADGANGRLVIRGWRGGTVTSIDNGATWSSIPDLVNKGTSSDGNVGYSPSIIAINATTMLEINSGAVPGTNRLDIRVGTRDFTPSTVADQFADGNDTGWTRYGGSWSVTSGVYNAASGTSGKSIIGEPTWTDYVVEADVKPVSGFNGGIVFRITNPGTGADAMNGYVAGVGNGIVFLGKMNGTYSHIADAPATVTANTWHRLKVVAVGSSIKVYLDDMTTPKISVTDTTHTAGAAGVRSHYANTQFDNFIARPVVADQFADGNDTGWTRYGGSWSVTSGVYNAASGTSGKSIIGEPTWTDYVVEADVKPVSGFNGGIVFRITNPGTGADAMNGYVAGVGNGIVFLGKMNGTYSHIADAPATVTANTWHRLKVVAVGSSIKVYLDDMTTPKISVTDTTHTAGAAGVRSHYANTQFDNFIIS